VILIFSVISRNCFCIGKFMDRDYGSRDHNSLSVYGGLVTMRQHSRSRAREVFVIAQGERDEVIGVLTNSTT
jgi:hypothetical protein